MFRRHFIALMALAVSLVALAAMPVRAADDGKRTAIFAGGCFWCVEADFDKVPGVVSTTSGYIGGSAETAHYKIVSSGGTGHYEAVKIVYDPKKVSYSRLLYVYWRSVDPTDPGGQFCDRGDSYKTAIFYANDRERDLALASKRKAEATLGKKIVTKIVKAGPFYPAEGYHQNYYRKNPVRYQIYRYGCRRDARISDLWGNQAHAGIEH
jgi:peptide-methionine (S)-S-oxide reductase